jgi:DNA replication protein DnaC
MPNGHLLDEIRNKQLREEINYDISDIREKQSISLPNLNQCQKDVYGCIISSVVSKQQVLVFVHGHGGTGKTFLWHTIINRLRSEGLIGLAVASFGIASLVLPEGRTAHSRFKIPLTLTGVPFYYI